MPHTATAQMMTPGTDIPTYADVEAAARRLAGVAHRTPVLTSRAANKRAGAELFFKCENFQRAGAFKFRGAYNAISLLSPAARKAGVLTYSSGNHAQAIALAGSLLGVPATVLMPEDAPAMKVAATQGYGAHVIRFDRYKDSRHELATIMANERGLTLIPPFDHADIIAGQGTAAKELIEETGALDALLICMGGGGLVAGCALAARALSPSAAIIGVEPEAGNDGQQSFRAGKIVEITVPRTLADGAQTTALGERNFAIIRRDLSDVLTVDDTELVATMRFFAERMKMIVEPTGCLAAAGAFAHAAQTWPGGRVGVIISGGNVDLAAFARLVA